MIVTLAVSKLNLPPEDYGGTKQAQWEELLSISNVVVATDTNWKTNTITGLTVLITDNCFIAGEILCVYESVCVVSLRGR